MENYIVLEHIGEGSFGKVCSILLYILFFNSNNNDNTNNHNNRFIKLEGKVLGLL